MVSLIAIVKKMDHMCEYRLGHRKVATKYNSAKTHVIQTTYVSVRECYLCGKIKPETPADEFVSIRTNECFDLIIKFRIMEEDEVFNERPLTCNWMDFIPMSKKEDPLFIRTSKIKETNCQCKSCSFLKLYVDFVEVQR